MRILVTGAAGYIGSLACKRLKQKGYQVFALDDLSRGNAKIDRWAKFYQARTHDDQKIAEILSENKIDAVMHFAAFAYVGESVANPEVYYENNVAGTISLLTAMQAANVKTIIFSSTCATYGEPLGMQPISEEIPQSPVNPYGRTKLICEQIISDFCTAHNFSAMAFRYFNAAGADPELEIGEMHQPETHLIPLLIRAALTPEKEVNIFGNDYPTHDGTAVRDYIHVQDIVDAHILSFEYLERNKGFTAINLGNNRGFSVLDILKAVEKLLGLKVAHKFAPRRLGDPAYLVGSNAKAKQVLSWSPQFSSIESILETAIGWEKKSMIRSNLA